MEKSQKVTILSSIVLVGFVFGVIFHYIVGFYMHAGEPYNSFLYPSSWAFCDIFGILPYIKDFKPYQDITLWVVYFPLTYLFMLPFAFIKNKIIAYLIYISGFIAYLIFMNIKNFSCKNLSKLQNFQNIFIITAISYPVLYTLDKGNFDMYLFVLLGFWTYAFKNEKYGLSAFLLAIINACKPFTLYFLLLYLMKKRYKECFFSIILTALLVICGFMIIPDNFFNQIIILIKSLALYKQTYAIGTNMGIGFSSSIFMPLKTIMLHFSTASQDVINFVKFYDYSCHIITIITLFFVWKEKIFWKQLTLLICNFLLLPYCTYDYKFIFLFIPLWLFMNEKEKSKLDLTYLILFALLFVPKNLIIYFPLIKNGVSNWLSLSAIINPIIILLLTLLIIYEQIHERIKLKKESI